MTFEAAVSLARAKSESIDWRSLEEEALSPGNRALGVDEALEKVRSAANPEVSAQPTALPLHQRSGLTKGITLFNNSTVYGSISVE